jgi:hypothetical protein
MQDPFAMGFGEDVEALREDCLIRNQDGYATFARAQQN